MKNYIETIDGQCIFRIYANGNKAWLNSKEEYHRLDGPAREDADGDETWFYHGKIHRLGGPARINREGYKAWAQNGRWHRTDGPAIEYVNGGKDWMQNGKRHRLDGPAVEYAEGGKEWWVEDELINCDSQEEFERLIRLRAFW